MAKRLIETSIDPHTSKFNMIALGPFFDEQTNFEEHKPLRDHMSTLEFEVANHLRKNGNIVLGNHHPGSEVPEDQLNEIKEKVIEFALE